MNRLAMTSLAAIENQSKVRAQITNALANVSTTGFKESFQGATQAIKLEGPGFESRFVPANTKRDLINLDPGSIQQTGNPMDVAFNGETVLGVQATNGEIGFSRRGDLRVNATGVIENAAGQLILGEGGAITVPPGQLVSISPDGSVFAESPSQPELAPLLIGQLMLRDASATPLVRRPDGLYEPFDKALRGQDFATGPKVASLQSGALEGSNVNPVEAMVRMMDFSRSFEAQIKLITEAKSLDETGSSMMRLP